jgi:hypothetical protein
MTTDDNATTPVEVARWRPQKIAIATLAAFLVTTCVILMVRGTWADSEIVNPSASNQGTITRLYRDPEGNTSVRCAAVLDFPSDRVWEVVTGYERFGKIFGEMSSIARLEVTDATHEADGQVHLVGRVSSLLGTWPVDVRVAHDETGPNRVASWDTSEAGHVNRGSWTISPLGEDRSLVVYLLEVQDPPYPNILVNNVLLNETRAVVDAVERELAKPSQAR